MTFRQTWIGSSILLLFSAPACADQGAINISASGSASVSGGVTTISSSGATPAGILNISTTTTSGTLSFVSSDGTLSLQGTISSSSSVEGCAGGGRGGHVTCGYTFKANFTGTVTINGLTQAIMGNSVESWTVGAPPSGTTVYNSAYTPLYFTNSGQIIRTDDILGTNAVVYGSQGSGVGQFYGVSGLALDSAGRIYVTDAYNSRIVRIDDMNGTNWTAFGAYGTGAGMFGSPNGIAIDPQGRIYVADSGNNCLIRMDDMNGTDWTPFCSVGSGTGQLSNFSAITIDAAGHIYIPDTGNARVVRMDDITGTNWTVMSQLPAVNGATYSVQSPFAVGVDAAGKIYIGEGSNTVLRVDDMTGANWVSISNGLLSAGVLPFHSVNVDSTGMVIFGGYGLNVVDEMEGIIASPNEPSSYGSYYVWGITPIPLPVVRPPALTLSGTALTYANQNINTSSAPQTITITNFGGSPLNFSSITANGGFVQTNNCPANLIAGSSCTVNVAFAPITAGSASGTLTLSDNSGNMGANQSISLTAFATQPNAFVVPGSLVFPPQVLSKASAAQSVTVQNTGTGPLQVSTVTVAAPFTQTNNCGTAIAPGGACTIGVSFTPVAAATVSGTLTIADNAGIQSVGLAGTGTNTAAVVTVAPSQLLFPPQLAGTKSAASTVTLTNTGKTAVPNQTPAITGDFSETTTCTSSIAAGKSCTVSVKFGPTASGARTGTLTLNLASGTQTVSLAGTGTDGSLPAALALSPTAVVFNNGYVVGDNPSQTVTVTNTSNASVGIASISMSGDAGLTQSNKCASVLGAGSTCSISVRFVPKNAGTFNSTLTLTEASGVADVVTVLGVASTGGN
jgi:hypothetical protein